MKKALALLIALALTGFTQGHTVDSTQQKQIKDSAMNFIILGAPGSGKGTQSDYIKEKLGTCNISTGDLLRHEVSTGSDLGKSLALTMKEGRLVEDQIVLNLLEKSVSQCKSGFILDGFPRNLAQAEHLEKLLIKLNKKLNAVIYLDVPENILIERISSRYLCSKCGGSYNKLFKNPKVPGICDKCGGTKFKTRADDNPETVKSRLQQYKLQTMPLIKFYKDKGLLHTISDANLDDIHKKIDELLVRIQ